MKVDYKTIDEYISQCPKEHKERLKELREFIKKYCPDATEKISWAMPTFYQKENLIHFCLHKNHIGLYPGAEAVEYFKDELSDYKTSKGAIQFSNDKKLPYDLIRKIVEFRVKEVSK